MELESILWVRLFWQLKMITKSSFPRGSVYLTNSSQGSVLSVFLTATVCGDGESYVLKRPDVTNLSGLGGWLVVVVTIWR